MKPVLIILTALALAGCYTQQKARQQFGKAAAAYPLIPAQYCAVTYPPKDSLIKGDSVVTFDTLWGAGRVDTLYSFHRDTVYITMTRPGKTIIQTVRVTDTIQIVNTAALSACQIENGDLSGLLKAKTAEYDKWREIARTRFWIILGLGVLIVGYAGMKIYSKFK